MSMARLKYVNRWEKGQISQGFYEHKKNDAGYAKLIKETIQTAIHTQKYLHDAIPVGTLVRFKDGGESHEMEIVAYDEDFYVTSKGTQRTIVYYFASFPWWQYAWKVQEVL